MDRRGRDQFAIRYGDETEIYWNDHQKALAEEVSAPSATSTDRLLSHMSCSALSAAKCLHPVLTLEPVLSLQVYKRSFWTESFVQWSPKGGYLGTVHTRGVAVWGGPSFARLQRFTHTEVGPLGGHQVSGCMAAAVCHLNVLFCKVGKKACPAREAARRPFQCEKVWRQQ